MSTLIRLVVGLGNPGSKYRETRHNAGFMVIERLAGKDARWQKRYRGEIDRVPLGGRNVDLLRPLTYMNDSGVAVQSAMTGLKLRREELLIVHDELDLPFGTVRFRRSSGDGGHNGLRSIYQHIGRGPLLRLRIGIGRPPRGQDVTGWVLGRFSPDERQYLPQILDRAAEAAERVARDGYERAVEWLHSQPAADVGGADAEQN